MTAKNQGYLLEFIANNGYGENVYYECGYNEYKTILSSWSDKEVKDRSNCDISWAEFTEQYHNENLYSAI